MPSEFRVTQSQIDALFDAAETSEHIFWDKVLVVSYKFPNGFTIEGTGACVDPANFDLEIGRKVARENAEKQLWLVEGYQMQNKFYRATLNNKG